MNATKLKIGICQMTSIDDVEVNLKIINRLVENAVECEAKAVFFPENSLYMRICEGQRIDGIQLSSPAFANLQKQASRLDVHIHLGSVPLRVEGELFNSSVLISPDGTIESSYHKIHLFDIGLEGQKAIRESDIFKGGSTPKTFEINGWKFGQSICYDLRFAELYLAYSRMGVDVLLIPAAFLVDTGKVHWESLVRARAIENQCFVIAAAQAGRHVGVTGCERDTYGHSMGVDPWGRVIVEGAPTGASVYVMDLDRDVLNIVRRQIPMKAHRRL